MKPLSILKKSFCYSCYGFCIMTLLYSLIMYWIDSYAHMYSLTVLLFFPFCFSLVFSAIWLRYSKMKFPVRCLIHYIVTMLACWFFIISPHSSAFLFSPAGIIGILAALTLVYAVIVLIVFIIKSNKRKKANQKIEYKNVYKK